MKVKIMAVDAGLTSISVEGNQMILRFPEEKAPDEHVNIPPEVRVGKSAYWVSFESKGQDWPDFLVNLLETLSNPS